MSKRDLAAHGVERQLEDIVAFIEDLGGEVHYVLFVLRGKDKVTDEPIEMRFQRRIESNLPPE
jgi:hypothetical protein